MKPISIEGGFDWAQRFAAREWKLLLPVVLAFLTLPPLAFDLLLPPELARVLATPPVRDLDAVRGALSWLLPTMLAMLALAMLGTLTITALAVRPGISVGEAIVVAARRLPAFAGALAIVAAVLVALAFVLVVLTQLAGVGAARLGVLVMLCLVVAMIAGGIRLALLAPVMIEHGLGPAAGLAAAWRMAGGAFWRIAGGLLIYMLGALIVLLALTTSLNAVILLVARWTGYATVAPPLMALLFRVIAAIMNMGSYLLIVGFYRQLAGSNRAI